MVTTRGKEAIALLLVVVVVLAALTAGVMIKNGEKDDNPNGILGMYEIADYTQYGTEDASATQPEWKWYYKGDTEKKYDTERICIDSYKDGVITATCYIGDEELEKCDKFSITGYYDPETGAFGYGSIYNYTPTGNDKVVDALHGYIIGNTMYLRGYTISADDESNVIYTFNFTFVKEGETPLLIEFNNVISKDYETNNEINTYTYDGNVGCYYDGDVGYKVSLSTDPFGYKNGVYGLDITYSYNDESGLKKDVKYKMSATTMYQDNDRTYLRGASYYSDDNYQGFFMCWICIEGDQMYVIDHTTYDNCSDYYLYCLTSNGASVKSYATYDLNGKTFDTSLSQYSALTGKFTDSSFTSVFSTKLADGEHNSFTTPMVANGKIILVNVFPEVNYVAFNTVLQQNGQTYYSDMLGYVDENGNIITFGFAFSGNGDVSVIQGTMNVKN